MMQRRTLLGGMGGLLAQSLVQAQATGGRKVVFEHALPDLNIKNFNVTAIEVTFGPGESSGAHRHPGITIVYVLEGEIRSKVGDGPETTYGVGQMFIETPNQLHGVSANASKTKPAKFLALLLAEKGKQLTVPA